MHVNPTDTESDRRLNYRSPIVANEVKQQLISFSVRQIGAFSVSLYPDVDFASDSSNKIHMIHDMQTAYPIVGSEIKCTLY